MKNCQLLPPKNDCRDTKVQHEGCFKRKRKGLVGKVPVRMESWPSGVDEHCVVFLYIALFMERTAPHGLGPLLSKHFSSKLSGFSRLFFFLEECKAFLTCCSLLIFRIKNLIFLGFFRKKKGKSGKQLLDDKNGPY